MRFCARCVYPENHPLGIIFDDQGVCSGCRIHEEKDRLDWSVRLEKLKRIVAPYKSRTGKTFDCIIPVSGARDSYFIVHVVKNVLKMNPLLVSYNKHYNTKVGIRNLAYLRTLIGCDFTMQTLSPDTVKKITRVTLGKMGSMYWHCLAGQTVFPVQVAVRFKIPLIIWGVHQGCDQVGMFSHLDEVEMTRKYRKDHDLMGYEAEDLLPDSNLSYEDIRAFVYPHEVELERVGVRGIYLSNYIRWDSKKQHEDMIKTYGYESFPQARTFDTYNDVDSFHYSSLHDYIKFLKWGYGKVTDHAAREIRLKRLTREQGIDLIKAYSTKGLDEFNLKLFLQWIGMEAKDFFPLIDRYRDVRIWRQGNGGTWELRDSIENHRCDPGIDAVRLSTKEKCEFQRTPLREPNYIEGQYILYARGHVDQPVKAV
jgi:N-acetyl sugar amidotransferase